MDGRTRIDRLEIVGSVHCGLVSKLGCRIYIFVGLHRICDLRVAHRKQRTGRRPGKFDGLVTWWSSGKLLQGKSAPVPLGLSFRITEYFKLKLHFCGLDLYSCWVSAQRHADQFIFEQDLAEG